MSKELMCSLITRMHIKLNHVIEINNYNLLSEEVQKYSRRLDRVIAFYNKLIEKEKESSASMCKLSES